MSAFVEQVFADLMTQVPALFRGTVTALLRENHIALCADYKRERIEHHGVTLDVDARILQGDEGRPPILIVLAFVVGARTRSMPPFFIEGGPLHSTADDEYKSALGFIRLTIEEHSPQRPIGGFVT